MANFTVTVSIDVPALNLHRDRSKTIEISPAYAEQDRVHLYALVLEDIAEELVLAEGWVPPMREAALSNDAKIQRIEYLIKTMDAETRSLIMQVVNTAPEVAIQKWGGGAIED